MEKTKRIFTSNDPYCRSEDLTAGLRYVHTRVNDTTRQTLKAASLLSALVELLHEKGLLDAEELQERQRQVGEQLIQKFAESGLGLMYQEPEHDKYDFAEETRVNCRDRIEVCKAACCRMPFALSRQDVEEGVIRWQFGRPYLIAHDDDGYCDHLDRNTYQCTVHEHRPVPCRGFDCRENEKWTVWQDYDRMILHDGLGDVIAGINRNLYELPRDGACRPGTIASCTAP